jgi:hypothetical protein
MLKPHEMFFEIFPQSFPLLQTERAGADSTLWKIYLDEMELSEVRSWEDLRYFAAFVGQRIGRETFVAESLLWEWVSYSLAKQEIESHGKGEQGRIFLNPLISFVRLSHAHPEFHKEPGLYALAWNEQMGLVIEHRLEPLEAQMIDLLEEDRKYTKEQLLEMSLLELPSEFQTSKGEGEKRLQSLLQANIILVGKG